MLGPFIFLLSVLFPAEWLAAMSDIAQKGGGEGGGQGRKVVEQRLLGPPPSLPPRPFKNGSLYGSSCGSLHTTEM